MALPGIVGNESIARRCFHIHVFNDSCTKCVVVLPVWQSCGMSSGNCISPAQPARWSCSFFFFFFPAALPFLCQGSNLRLSCDLGTAGTPRWISFSFFFFPSFLSSFLSFLSLSFFFFSFFLSLSFLPFFLSFSFLFLSFFLSLFLSFFLSLSLSFSFLPFFLSLSFFLSFFLSFSLSLSLSLSLFLVFFWGEPHPQHMEVPRLGVSSEPYLPAYTTGTATRDPSRVCDGHHSSRQCQILNPTSEPGIKPATSWFLVGFVSTTPGWQS